MSLLIITGLSGFVSAAVKELRCVAWDSNAKWGDHCYFNNMEPILPGTEHYEFRYTGFNDQQKANLNLIIFKTANIAFIPKETFTTFPKLNVIGFQDIDMETLTFDWLNSITKGLPSRIRGLYIHNSGINKMEPSVLGIFNRFDRLELKGNRCIQLHLLRSDGDFIMLNQKLQNCFTNYMQANFQYILTEKLEKISILYDTLLNSTIGSLKTDIGNLRTDLKVFEKRVQNIDNCLPMCQA